MKRLKLVLSLLMITGAFAFAFAYNTNSSLVFAAATNPPADQGDVAVCPPGQVAVKDNPNADNSGSHTCCPAGTNPNDGNCLFQKYINPAIKMVAIGAGVMAVFGLIIGGLRYTTSEGDPQKAAKAKSTIRQAIVGFVSFLFLFTFMQFMTPGGIVTQAQPQGGGASGKACAKTFLGLKPWFYYLPGEAFQAGTCDITNFSFLGDGANRKSDIPAVVLAVTDSVIRLAGLIAVAYVIVGGVYYITSQGEPDKARRALQTIINALIGLAVVIVSAAIISFLGNKLGG